MDKLIAILKQMLENKNGSSNIEITTNTNLRNDLGFDSIELAELTVRIEDEFGIDVFEDGLINTIGEILLKIEK